MPVLLCEGLRLFEESAGLESVRLHRIGVQEIVERTSLRFRVEK